MIFEIEPSNEIYTPALIYTREDYSFNMEPVALTISFGIVLNTLHLSMNKFDHVFEIWGYCPYPSWRSTENTIPRNYDGKLKAIATSDRERTNIQNNVDFAIRDEEWPVYINKNNGAICFGNKDAKGPAVQFIKNCFAVIDNRGQLEALWLKPQFFGI